MNYTSNMKVGDRAVCLGIGYPHWKGKIIEITAVFNDNKTIGFKNDSCGIRVYKEDFKYLPKDTEVIEIMGKCILLKREFMPIFQGCQCHKDCNCKEEFNKSKKKCTSYDVFTGKRTYSFYTLDKAMEAMKGIYTLQTASNNKV